MTARDVEAVIRRHTVGRVWSEVGVDRGNLRLDLVHVDDVRRIVTGYEIKVSRQDWRQDTKWPDYLPWCHQLYIVAPEGVVDLEDVGDRDVGLLVVRERELRGQTITSLVRRRAARRRPMDPELALPLLYHLIGRGVRA